MGAHAITAHRIDTNIKQSNYFYDTHQSCCTTKAHLHNYYIKVHAQLQIFVSLHLQTTVTGTRLPTEITTTTETKKFQKKTKHNLSWKDDNSATRFMHSEHQPLG